MTTRDILLVAAGAALGCTLLVTCQSFVGVVVIPDGLGPLISGVGTLAAACAALAGLDRWQIQKRRERQAEVAGNGLVVAFELARVLRTFIDGGFVRGQVNAQTEKVYLTSWSRKFADEDWRTRFDQAHQQIEAYLPDDAVKAWEELRTFRDEAQEVVELRLYHMDTNDEISERAHARLNVVQSDDSMKRLDYLVEDLKKSLRRFALLE
jgi:hypothetical protein